MDSATIAMFQSTVIYVDDRYIPVSATCNFFGITYRSQIDKIKNHYLLKNEWKLFSSELVFGDKRSRVCLTIKGFVRWIGLLNPALVSDHLKEKLVQFQILIDDWLYGNIEKRHAVQKKYQRLQEINAAKDVLVKEEKQLQREIDAYVRGILSHQPELEFPK